MGVGLQDHPWRMVDGHKKCLGLRCIRQERLIDQLKQVETNSQDRAGGPWWAMVIHGEGENGERGNHGKPLDWQS